MRFERPPAGWSSLVLVTLMLLCVAWALEAQTLNVAGLEILTYVVLGGVITGVVLGAMEWMPATLAHGWAIVVSIVGATVLATFVLGNYESQAALAELTLFDRMGLVRTWFFSWLRDVSSGGFPDAAMASFVFVFAMALLLWLISYVCVWFVVRYVSWWGAVLPCGFALLTVLYNSQQRHMVYLVFFLFCALLLAAKTHLALQEDRWRREHIGFSTDLRFDVLRDGLVVALVVVGFGWLAPTDVDTGPLRSLMTGFTSASTQVNSQLTKWFPNVRIAARGGGAAFGNELPLGGSISLNRDPVFDAHVEGGPPPRYFRMAVFDQYSGNTWLRTPSGIIEGEAGQLDLATDYGLTVPITQTIAPFLPLVQQLYAAPQPESFSIPVRAAVSPGPDSGDVMTVEARTPLEMGSSTYTVVSRASAADVDSLRAASEPDPPWVTARYLQLPATVPDRVRAVATQIQTESGATSRYELANAIEAYLRQFPYSEQIGTPPSDRDRVDWFLFDERRGYCDYYASSFVVLARSLGIPARFAAGYSLSPTQETSGAWRIRNADAHTWPEVFFPGYGWIEFEPTAGDAQIERPSRVAGGEATPTPIATAGGPDADPTQEPDMEGLPPKPPGGGGGLLGQGGFDWVGWGLRLGLLFIGLAAIALVAAFAWRRPLVGLSVAERAFAQFVRLARLVGLQPQRVETPYEYGRRVAGAIPDAGGEITTITDAYVRERFARRPADDQAGALATAWLRLRRSLLRGGLRMRLATRRKP